MIISIGGGGTIFYLRTFFAFAALLFVVSCSGNGIQATQIAQSIGNSVGGGKVYVLRDTGGIGVLDTVTVKLNGQSIGELGEKETAFGNSSSGTNFLSARMNGLAGMSTNDAPVVLYEKRTGKNNFFLINMYLATLTGTLGLNEVSEDVFRKRALGSKFW